MTWIARLKTPPPRIEVLYHADIVAELSRTRDGKYVFIYLPAFYEKKLAALPGLPFGKEHASVELFPFFAERIPELCRPEVLEWLRRHSVDPEDKFELLGTLGKRSVTDSFELHPAA
jgi:HipA-like protein